MKVRLGVRALARKTGTDHSHISRVMRGEKLPSLGLLIKMAEALGVSPQALINELADRGIDRAREMKTKKRRPRARA